jgi:hypothetical protein
MDWKGLISIVFFSLVVGYVYDKFKDLLTDIRDSLRNIEAHLTEDEEED